MYEYEYGINLRHCNASLRYYKFFSLSVFFIILVQSHLASLFTEENNLEKFYSALSWTALNTSFWKVHSNFLYKIIVFDLLEYAHMHYVMFFDIITDKTYVKIVAVSVRYPGQRPDDSALSRTARSYTRWTGTTGIFSELAVLIKNFLS